MLSYDYVPVNGHVVAHIRGRRFLVDMGIPNTIARRPLLLGNQKVDVEEQSYGLRLEDFSRLVGLELDGVLGAHLSSDYVINLLPQERCLVFDNYLPDYALNISVENLAGLPYMHQSIGSQRVRGLLNPGSGLSWIQPELVTGYKYVGQQKEIFGYIGDIVVDVYSLPFMVGTQTIYLKFAAMPTEAARWLKLANVDAIVGAELLEHFAVSIALEDGTVSLDRLH